MTAAFDWSPGGCCCIVNGPWDFYHEGDTSELPFIPRTASIYLDPPNFPETSHDTGSPTWSVEVPNTGDGADYQDKVIAASISPLGITNSEIVYLYCGSATSGNATIKIDAEGETVEWFVRDSDWEDATWPVMGAVSMGPTDYGSSPGSGSVQNLAWAGNPFGVVELGGHCAHAGGLRRWYWAAPTTLQLWAIDQDGSFSYETWTPYLDYAIDFPDEYQHWGDSEREDVDHPRYTAEIQLTTASSAGPIIYFYDSFPAIAGFLANYQSWAAAVGQANQADVAVGIRYPYVLDMPERLEDYLLSAGTTYTASAEVVAGDLDRTSDYGFPFVSGSVIYDISKTYTFTGFAYDSPNEASSIANAERLTLRVDGFDANDSHSIVIVDFTYWTSWTVTPGSDFIGDYTEYFPEHNAMDTALIIAGTEISVQPVFATATSTNLSMFFPRWINPRALHTTESAQGGGNRSVVFQRVPYDPTEAADYSSSALHQWRLQCYLGSTLDYSLLSRWPYYGQATGTVTFASPTATMTLTAVGGGDADGTEGNTTVTVAVDDDPDERADYNKTTNTLTVKIDFAGGHDTIDDLAVVINDGGDFTASVLTGGTATIAGATSGSGTLAGGDGGPTIFDPPFVHDSSDRYMYVCRFRHRVTQVLPGVGAGTKIKRSYHTNFLLSHDGELCNPAGEGTLWADRGGAVGAMGDQSFGVIKNNTLIELGPALEEI